MARLLIQPFTMCSPLPSSQVRRLRVVMSISRCRASLVVHAMCGVRMALGRLAPSSQYGLVPTNQISQLAQYFFSF